MTYEPDWGRIVAVGGYEYNSRKIEDEGDANPGTELEAVLDDETEQYTGDLRVELDDALGIELADERGGI